MSFQNRSEWLEDAKQRAIMNETQVGNNSRELAFMYDEAAVTIEKEIAVLYSRFAKENGLSTAEAERILSSQEHSVWRKTIKQYFDEASDKAKGSEALLELNTLAMKSRISRKEQMLGNIYRNLAQLADKADGSLEAMLSDMYRVNYERSSFSVQKGFGLGFHMAKIDEEALKKILSGGWGGWHYSKTIWEHCDKLTELARREISLGLLQGKSVQQMAKSIDDIMEKGRYSAIRLVRTECKYYASKGEMDAYKANGITQYDVIGTPDGNKCKCNDVSGEGPYNVSEANAGTNLPPLHPNCVCYVVAHFEKNIFAERPDAKPLAENIKFQEWKQKYVDNGAELGIMKDIELRDIPVTDEAIQKVPMVKARTLSGKQSRQLAEQERELLRLIQDEPLGREAICYCDMKMNVITQYIGDGLHSVKPTQISVPHIIAHSHPSGLTFTQNDIALFARNDASKIMTAVGNNGNVFLMEKAKGYDAPGLIQFLNEARHQTEDYMDTPENYVRFMENFLKEASKYGFHYTKAQA